MKDWNAGSDIGVDGIFCIFMWVSALICYFILRNLMALIPAEVFFGGLFTVSGFLCAPCFLVFPFIVSFLVFKFSMKSWCCLGRFLVVLFLVLFGAVVQAQGDVTFVHDVEAEDLFTGKKALTLMTSYRADGMYMDQQRRYTGSWMRLLFGGVREDRRTVIISLASQDIREIDWGRDKCRIFPLNRLKDPEWLRTLEKPREESMPLMADRYQVRTPEMTIKVEPAVETVGRYACRKVVARLRQDTYDRLREAHSVTEVEQHLWVSNEVPGLDEALRVQAQLGAILGMEVERLGPLSFLLSYWQGTLQPLAEDLARARGYPVKSVVRVTAHYIPKEGESRRVSRVVNEETSLLKEVLTKFDEEVYRVPPHFTTVHVP